MEVVGFALKKVYVEGHLNEKKAAGTAKNKSSLNRCGARIWTIIMNALT
jgi:hypothetical protein